MIVNFVAPLRRAFTVVTLACTAGLAQPTLHITSPADGTVVHPGESLTVIVEVSGGALKGVFVIGTDPIGGAQELKAPPYRFTVEIPRKIDSGIHVLTAEGYTSPPTKVKRDAITIDIERSDSPVRLQVGPTSSLVLPVGDKVDYLWVSGTFADGMTTDLTQSTLTSIKSDNIRVATIRNKNNVVAVAPGSAKIIITNDKARIEVPVKVLQVKEWHDLLDKIIPPEKPNSKLR